MIIPMIYLLVLPVSYSFRVAEWRITPQDHSQKFWGNCDIPASKGILWKSQQPLDNYALHLYDEEALQKMTLEINKLNDSSLHVKYARKFLFFSQCQRQEVYTGSSYNYTEDTLQIREKGVVLTINIPKQPEFVVDLLFGVLYTGYVTGISLSQSVTLSKISDRTPKIKMFVYFSSIFLSFFLLYINLPASFFSGQFFYCSMSIFLFPLILVIVLCNTVKDNTKMIRLAMGQMCWKSILALQAFILILVWLVPAYFDFVAYAYTLMPLLCLLPSFNDPNQESWKSNDTWFFLIHGLIIVFIKLMPVGPVFLPPSNITAGIVVILAAFTSATLYVVKPRFKKPKKINKQYKAELCELEPGSSQVLSLNLNLKCVLCDKAISMDDVSGVNAAGESYIVKYKSGVYLHRKCFTDCSSVSDISQ